VVVAHEHELYRHAGRGEHGHRPVSTPTASSTARSTATACGRSTTTARSTRGAPTRPAPFAIQPDGKIVVRRLGGEGDYFNDPNIDFAVARINTNGSMDHSFGDHGQTYFTMLFQREVLTSVAVQSTARSSWGGVEDVSTGQQIVVARMTSNGGMDNTFKGYGHAPSRDSDRRRPCASWSSGPTNSILVVGSAGGNFAMVRFTRTVRSTRPSAAPLGRSSPTSGGSDGAATAMYTADGQILAAAGPMATLPSPATTTTVRSTTTLRQPRNGQHRFRRH
jgi:uncharacterized delta-60 repeat protein